MSELIGEFNGRGIQNDRYIVSSGDVLLIDFHLNDSNNLDPKCYAAFIGHVEIIGKIQNKYY
jgi:hypothetical protein